MGGELLTARLILLKFLVVDCSDLVQLSFVVRMFYRGLGLDVRGRGRGAARLVRPGHALGDQHVVEPHQLRVRRVVLVEVAEAEGGPLLDLAEDAEQGGLHAVTVEGVFPGLGLVQALVGNVEDLVEQEVDVGVAGALVLRVLGVPVGCGRAHLLPAGVSRCCIVRSLPLHLGAVHK